MSVSAVNYSSNPMQMQAKQQWEKKREQNNQHILNHEKQHLAAAGEYAAGGIHMDYNSDGWATGGHVNIKMPPKIDKNTSPEMARKALKHAEVVKGAALAPSDPSSQDMKVAAQATQIMFQANQLLSNNNGNQMGGNPAINPANAGKKLNITA